MACNITIQVPPPIPLEAEPENIPLEILYEDEDIIFVNKAAGMVTHPAPGNYSGTLVNAILHHCPDLMGIGGVKRPGIVHRLDKGTSGVMVIAKSQKAMENLIMKFKTHDLERKYEALAVGKAEKQSGMLKSLIGRSSQNRLKMTSQVTKGKEAITHFKVLNQFENLIHYECKLETGRTHQIRVHLTELLRTPLLMDPVYGNPKQHLTRVNPSMQVHLRDYPHPLLHAKSLKIKHPLSNEELYFQAEPPEVFRTMLSLMDDGK